MLENQLVPLVCVGIGMLIMFGVIPLVANHYSLNGIKSKTVGDGQYGTARFGKVHGTAEREIYLSQMRRYHFYP